MYFNIHFINNIFNDELKKIKIPILNYKSIYFFNYKTLILHYY